MRIAICGDNKEYSANLENMIENMRIRDIEVDIFGTGQNLLNYLEQKLNNSWFIRIHASYLINIDYLKELRCDLAVMINGDVLPISKRYKKCVKLEHLRYMKWRLGF